MRHPIHPALVHFPITCWVMALPCDLIAWSGWLSWSRPAYFLILGGVLLALPAMLAGMLDFKRLEDDESALPVAYRHVTLIACAWLSYLVSLMLRLESLTSPPGLAAVAATATGFVFLLAGAWHGAELVYTHGVGVHQDRAPKNTLTMESTEYTEGKKIEENRF